MQAAYIIALKIFYKVKEYYKEYSNSKYDWIRGRQRSGYDGKQGWCKGKVDGSQPINFYNGVLHTIPYIYVHQLLLVSFPKAWKSYVEMFVIIFQTAANARKP